MELNDPPSGLRPEKREYSEQKDVFLLSAFSPGRSFCVFPFRKRKSVNFFWSLLEY